jgi:hypothetical protein
MPMKRIRVLNGHAESEIWIERLRAAGYDVDARKVRAPDDLKALGRPVPAAVAIDLARAPGHGRDLGLAVRQMKATRQVPLVFVDGTTQQVERLRGLLPGAVYSSGRRIRSAVQRAIARPPRNPERPASVLAGYSGTPLPKKLGIKSGSAVRLVGAPRGFETTLGALPEAVTIRRRGDGPRDLAIWFTRRLRELEHGIEQMAGRVTTDKLWIVWAKKTSPLATDVSEPDVRAAGLAHGLVDFKICAVDADWSGLLFSRRKKP